MRNPSDAPGAARIVARDLDRPGAYTVTLDLCPCGAMVDECGCRNLVTRWTVRVEFADIPRTRRVPPLTAAFAGNAELALRVYRYLRPFYGNPDIEVALTIERGTGSVFAHGVRAGSITVSPAPRSAAPVRRAPRPARKTRFTPAAGCAVTQEPTSIDAARPPTRRFGR